MREFQRTTPAISSVDQQAPVVFMDIQDGQLVKMIMTREEAEARRAAAVAQQHSLSSGDEYPLGPMTEHSDDEQGRNVSVLTERRSGLSAKKIMAKFAVAAMVIAPYPIGDTISTFLQSGNAPSIATMIEDVTQLPGQSAELYQGVVATIQGAKSITDTINSIKGNK